jgi:uncharacterized membrane protein YbaN (DUF454 family)
VVDAEHWRTRNPVRSSFVRYFDESMFPCSRKARACCTIHILVVLFIYMVDLATMVCIYRYTVYRPDSDEWMDVVNAGKCKC